MRLTMHINTGDKSKDISQEEASPVNVAQCGMPKQILIVYCFGNRPVRT